MSGCLVDARLARIMLANDRVAEGADMAGGPTSYGRSGVYPARVGWLAVFVSSSGGGSQTPCRTRAEAEAKLQEKIESDRQLWLRTIDRSRTDPAFIVVNGRCYAIGPEGGSRWKPNSRPWFGYDGREFHIRKHDGTEIVTHNLWSLGTVPPEFLKSLPDSARFLGPSP
jgi:hypothetical protein